MARVSDPTTEPNLLLDALMDRVRQSLRARIMERIEPDIQAAVDEAAASFKVAVENWCEPHEMRNTVRVLIEKR